MQLSLLLAMLPLALAAPAPVPEPAPFLRPRAGSAIPGRYIVKMKNENLDSLVNSALKVLKKDPRHVYKFGAFGGFAADLSDDTLDLLRHFPGVCSVCSIS